MSSRRRRGTGLHGRRAARAVLAGAGLCALSVGVPAWAGQAAAAAHGRKSPAFASPAVPATWSAAGGSWAYLPMGDFASQDTTFWQVLHRPSGHPRWTLVTPPGVATNGGIVGDAPTAATRSLAVGFLPAKNLRTSPVAKTADAGATWAPGILPAGLVPSPDALTAGPAGTTLAVLSGEGGRVVASAGSLTRWHTVVSEQGLARSPAGRSCGVTALRSVAAGATVEVGTTCARPGSVGILTRTPSGWAGSGVTLGGVGRTRPTAVLRLVSIAAAGTAALVEAGSGRGGAVYALWRSHPSAPWTVSGPVRLDAAVSATGFAVGGSGIEAVVVTGRLGRPTGAFAVAGPAARWRRLPAPPAGTAAVVGTASSGGFDSLVVHRSAMTDWHLGAGSGTWRKGGTVRAPIQYGSSG